MKLRAWRDRLLQQEDLNFLLTNRIPRAAATRFMGWFSQIEHPWVCRASIALWRLFTELDLSEARETQFKSLHACFVRELKPGARPVEQDPAVLASREEARRRAALDAAREASLDLVEVSGDQEVPVVKILDYGKLRFEERKKKAAARKKQKSSELKEIKIRPNIDTHDYEVKARAITRFFEEGDKVKITLRFRGREMAHQHLGMELLEKMKTDFAEAAKVELEPKLEGKQMTMVLAPR